METKSDTIFGQLRDVGIFLLGVSAAVFTAFYIWSQLNSPEREMRAIMQKNIIDNLKQPSQK